MKHYSMNRVRRGVSGKIQAATCQTARAAKRRGVVLLSVLIVVVLLSLAAYQYTDLMTTEYKVGENAVRMAQARAAAESGIHYVAAMMADPENVANFLYGNPWDNEHFRAMLVRAGETPRNTSRVSIVSPRDDDANNQLGPRYGLTDEAAKINPNALMVLDPTGNTLYNLLVQLPNMTADIANSIVYWLDPAAAARVSLDGGTGAADNTYYQALSPSYSAKNGPIQSIEELLLVRDVTPQLLFGADLNRNGWQDSNEMTPDGSFDRGWAACLTVYSKESNLDSVGNLRLNLNEPTATTDLQTWFTNLVATGIDGNLAIYLLMARLNTVTAGSAESVIAAAEAEAAAQQQQQQQNQSNNTGGRGGGGGGNTQTKTFTAGTLGSIDIGTLNLTSAKPKTINSLFDLMYSCIQVQGNVNGKQATIIYDSPLNDSGSIRDLFPALYDKVTTSQDAQILGRINVNNCNQTVLQCLGNMNVSPINPTVTPYFSDADMVNIIASRPQPSATQTPDPIYNTPAWLVSEANIDPAVLKKLEKYITTTTQVYRFQVLGYFDEGGLAARLEAVIDTNQGYPRILYQRDLSDLGKGYQTK